MSEYNPYVVQEDLKETIEIPDPPVSEKKKSNAVKYILRTLLCIFTALAIVVYGVLSVCYTIATGPSKTVRDLAVLSALQASATKWVPGLFLSDETVNEIKESSNVVIEDVISLSDYDKKTEEEIKVEEDKWANAKDGILYETYSGSTFKAYIVLVRDPSRIFTGVSSENYATATEGITVFKAAEKYNALVAINGGEFADGGGMGTGYAPVGLTYSKGSCVWNDGARRTFIGFTNENKLVVSETMTKDLADSMGMRDGVSFFLGNSLITCENDVVTRYYEDNNNGTAQRTAIGQTADGTVIMAVTDGRSASSIGATHNDMVDLMMSYGAVTAGMLDGGSSSVMYYRDFHEKLGIDYESLDQYGKQGLVNNYVAFTSPRRCPTYFIVTGVDEQ
ncbi:MAG: phosphodiester glycosidase family protein [Clostridia bacterium]|nr:phosphodiester glycosidase family protein [Clostridia bacterium]